MPIPHSIALDFPIVHLIIARCIAQATEFVHLLQTAWCWNSYVNLKIWCDNLTWAKVSLGNSPFTFEF